MVDLYGKDKGNISLPPKLQSYEDGDHKNKPTIISMQRASYNIKIADIENRLNRLEERNDELIEEIAITNEQSVIKDSETAEEIANLNRQVAAQNNSIENLKDKINTVENNRIEDKRSHEEKIELFNQKYKNKKVELVSQIKVLNAKINVLEDFKKAQNGLEGKLEANKQQMIENEKYVEETMEVINRKIEFNKEMLKTEMYNCLLDLAAQFQVEISKRISLPNQRLMRENVMLKNELLQISEEISSKIETRVSLKNAVIEYNKKIDLKSSLVKENIVVEKVQDAVLKHLRKKLEKLKERYRSINISNPAKEEKYFLLIENTRREHNNVNFQLSSLRTLLHKERTKINFAQYVLKKLDCKTRAVIETIYDLKYTVTCLLKCPSGRKDLMTFTCIELFLFLRNLLIKGKSKLGSNIVKSSESIHGKLKSISSMEDIDENIDFEITMDFISEKSHEEILHEGISKISIDKQKSLEEAEAFNILEDITSIDSNFQESFNLLKADYNNIEE